MLLGPFLNALTLICLWITPEYSRSCKLDLPAFHQLTQPQNKSPQSLWVATHVHPIHDICFFKNNKEDTNPCYIHPWSNNCSKYQQKHYKNDLGHCWIVFAVDIKKAFANWVKAFLSNIFTFPENLPSTSFTITTSSSLLSSLLSLIFWIRFRFSFGFGEILLSSSLSEALSSKITYLRFFDGALIGTSKWMKFKFTQLVRLKPYKKL